MTAGQMVKLLEGVGMSQRRLAKELGLNERTVRRYVSGEVKIPKVVEVACKAVAWEITMMSFNELIGKIRR